MKEEEYGSVGNDSKLSSVETKTADDEQLIMTRVKGLQRESSYAVGKAKSYGYFLFR